MVWERKPAVREKKRGWEKGGEHELNFVTEGDRKHRSLHNSLCKQSVQGASPLHNHLLKTLTLKSFINWDLIYFIGNLLVYLHKIIYGKRKTKFTLQLCSFLTTGTFRENFLRTAPVFSEQNLKWQGIFLK